MPVKVRNMVKMLVIFSLWQGKKHGYELMNEVEKKTGKRPSASQIYPFLEKLMDNNLIEVEEEGGRGKKVYRLTEKGIEFVEKKLDIFSDIIAATIEKDLSVCAHCGCKVYEGGIKKVIDEEELKFCCEHCAESYIS